MAIDPDIMEEFEPRFNALTQRVQELLLRIDALETAAPRDSTLLFLQLNNVLIDKLLAAEDQEAEVVRLTQLIQES